MYYLETKSVDPYFNLAFEEYVLDRKRFGDYLMLWQNDNTVVIGQNQNTLAEINEAFVQEHGVRVVRRSTGGGAVYHDLGNLNYSFITDHAGENDDSVKYFTGVVTDALKGLGLQAEASGRNDILVCGRKVSGTAQRILGKRILYHGTLLFDSDMDMIAHALQADPEKFRSKSTGSVQSRVGNIRDFLPEKTDMAGFWRAIRERLSTGGVQKTELAEEELEEIRRLQKSKYESWEWNYGRSPEFSLRRRARFGGGSVEACLSVKKGLIREAVFYGDFLSRDSLDTVCDALKDQPFTKEAVREAWRPLDLPRYFGNISEEELLSLIFS